MSIRIKRRRGIIKYAIAWFMGVPLFLLVIIFLLFRGC
jgi:hypothetical protein